MARMVTTRRVVVSTAAAWLFGFLIFFPIVVTLYFLCPQRYRWLFLLAASYFFYAAWRLEERDEPLVVA